MFEDKEENWIFDNEVPLERGVIAKTWHHKEIPSYRRGRRYLDGNSIGNWEYAVPLLYLDEIRKGNKGK